MQCRKESEKLSLSESFKLLLKFSENNTEALARNFEKTQVTLG